MYDVQRMREKCELETAFSNEETSFAFKEEEGSLNFMFIIKSNLSSSILFYRNLVFFFSFTKA